MRGMILKDLYNLMRYSRFLIIYIIIFGAISLGPGGSTFGSMVVVLIGTLSVSTFSYDDLAGWEKYAVSTPVSRKKIVMAKYLVAVILTVLGIVAGLLLTLLSRIVNPEMEILESLAALGSCALLGVLANSLIIPFVYKFGTEKSRLIMMTAYALPAGVIILIGQVLPPESLTALIAWIENSFIALLVSIPLFCIAAICFSYVVAVKIFEAKEIQ